MKKTRILLIEDNVLLREGISAMIDGQEDLKVVTAMGDDKKIDFKIRESHPDIILIELGLQSMKCLDLVYVINKKFPGIKIIIFDFVTSQNDILDFIQAGVSGFILKNAISKEFLNTIRMVYEGNDILPLDLTRTVFSQIIKQSRFNNGNSKSTKEIRMTKREKQIVKLISDGLSNKEIVETLNLSVNTVKSHIHNILEKMSLHTRTQIAKYAFTADIYKDLNDSNSLLN